MFKINCLMAMAVLVVNSLAQAGPMDQAEFLRLVGGNYKSIQPVLDDRFSFDKPLIEIFERNGVIYLENRLAVETKNQEALYKMTRFECYNNSPTATTCEFKLELVDEGRFMHFLGVHPTIRVNRRAKVLTLEISPGYSLAGNPEADEVIAEKAQ
jgi:hypothetical protein